MLIKGRKIGPGESVYIIAELSANHGGSLSHACEVIHAMKEAGADAVKLQTYTADTLTVKSNGEQFLVGKGTLWEGRTLYDLYEEAHTPWEWHSQLFEVARSLGLDCFSTPFDSTAVDFLEQFDPPLYKIASFELVDIPLIQYVASKRRPMIISTGMGSVEEVSDAVQAASAENVPLALLKCTSAYPALPQNMNLRTIPHLSETFDMPCGLSDHTLGIAVPIAAVALGATIIEKHFTLSRKELGPDSVFSLEPHEFKAMVEGVRIAEQALGTVSFDLTDSELASRAFRRSLFVTKDVARGEAITRENVRSIRPGFGLPPRYLPKVIGRIAAFDLEAGTPLTWSSLV